MTKFLTTFLFVSLFAIASVMGQDRAPSPASTLTQKVGLTDITVEYSRPGMKGRTIFAPDGLVPYGKTWRTGANSATKITFSDAVKVEGKELAAGSYAVTTVPTATTWTVNFYPYEGTRWASYNEATPTVSVEVNSVKMDVAVETFLIDVNNIKDNSATIDFVWESTYAPVAVEVK